MLPADSCAVNFTKTGRIPPGKKTNTNTIGARPFIKWAGGKRRLIEQYQPLFPSPERYRRYFEPFLGGGAIFFHLQPNRAILADLNAELINCYRMVKEQSEALIAQLRRHKATEQYFYNLRETSPGALSPLERASRFIYLNKTCYNGLYRVNRAGQFNVPFGRYKQPQICDEEGLRAASAALQQAQLKVRGYDKTAETARCGDFLYFDPPYAPVSPTASFTSYTAENFHQQDQTQLAALAHKLNERGCLVMISNSDTELTRSLYQDFNLTVVQCPRSINSNAFARGPINELVIRNYK